MVRTDTERHFLTGLVGKTGLRQGDQFAGGDLQGRRCIRSHFAGEEVHLRRADEARHEEIGRAVIEIERHAELFELAGAQNGDLVGHGHGFHLIMRHIDHGIAETPVQAGNLAAHVDAQFRIEVGKRLIEKEHARLAHDGAANGDALALTAGQILRTTLQKLVDLQHLGHLVDLFNDVLLGCADILKPEGQVFTNRHMRIKGVGLEHHGKAAICGRHRVDHVAANDDVAAAQFLKARDHAQQGRLAAAGRANENTEFAVLDIEIDTLDHIEGTICLFDLTKLNTCHCRISSLRIICRPSMQCRWRCIFAGT
ncbi:hypothetical protein D3C86_1050670 [compost metagenome]